MIMAGPVTPQIETGKFRVWEETPEFKAEWEVALARFDRIKEILAERGHDGRYLELAISPMGAICVYHPPNRSTWPGWPYTKISSAEALRKAAESPVHAWLSLDVIEEWAKDPANSKLTVQAMWRAGFRRHKTSPDKWARRQNRASQEGCPPDLPGPQWPMSIELKPEEFEAQYQPLFIKDEGPGWRQQYFLRAQFDNKLLICPREDRWGSLEVQGVDLVRSLHLDPQQHGFRLRARGITVRNGEQQSANRCVLIEVAWGSADFVPLAVLSEYQSLEGVSSFLRRLSAHCHILM